MRSHREYGIKVVFGAALRNWDTLLIFEILYRSFGFLVWFPVQRYLLSLLPALVGERYLGQDNLVLVFRHPGALALLAGVLLMTGLFIFFEIITLFLYCEKGWERERVTARALVKEAGGKAAGLFVPRRLSVFLLLPALMFSAFSFISGYLEEIKVPEFIMEYILQDKLFFPLFVAGAILLHLLLFLCLFGFPDFLMGGCTFRAARRDSFRLLKRTGFRPFWKTVFYSFVFYAVSAAVAVGGILLLASGVRKFAGVEAGRGQFQMYLSIVSNAWDVFIGALASVFLCACIVVLNHQARGARRPGKERGRRKVKKSLFRIASAVGILALLVVFSESEIAGNLPVRISDQTQIIAHRAGAALAPENTEAALLRAVSDQTTVAEIDVQQLKDGTLIVMHDANFKRAMGKNLNVWEADAAAFQDLNEGQRDSWEYAGEPVPTLETMLLAAKGRIRLMIELKSTGHEKDLEEGTLSLIKKCGMLDQCLIASMDMQILERVKILEPGMKTVYISAVLLTLENGLEEIDAYSVETTALSADLVYQAHLQGKQVYAWTANSERTINKILRCGADGLITDNVPLAKYCMRVKQENLLFRELTELFFTEN